MKKLTALVLMFPFFVYMTLFSIPHTVMADSSSNSQSMWGGLDVFEFPCTCSEGLLFLHTFFPLYLVTDGELETTADFMTALSTPLVYNFHYLYVTTYGLGYYYDQLTDLCEFGEYPYCETFDTLGLISPISGSSPTL